MAGRQRSISTPIVLASITVALTVAILVGWTLIIVQNAELTRHVTSNAWLLVLGVVSLGFIITVLVLFGVFLVREILEVRRQNSFIDSVTHELKSPLASLKLCAETLPRAELSAAQREDIRQMMLDDVERLSVFIDDVLEASRIAHGRFSQTVTTFDLRALASRCADGVAGRHRLGPGAIRLAPGGPVPIASDATSLEIVIKNLLDNAVKYSGDDVSVDVRVEMSDDSSVRVEVRDNGIGIARRHLKRVFERFFRAPTEAARARHGTGLGLFVVRALVRDLGGRVAARSDGEGRGTSMEVWLPAR